MFWEAIWEGDLAKIRPKSFVLSAWKGRYMLLDAKFEGAEDDEVLEMQFKVP